MKITNTIILTLSAAALSLAAPQYLNNDTPTSPSTPTEFDPAHPIPDLALAADPSASTEPPQHLSARDSPPRLRYCQHANGGGGCKNQDFQGFKCYNLEPYWNDRVSSIYTNPGWRCRLFTDKNCNGRSVEFRTPGVLDLKSSGLNDRGSSFRCVSYQPGSAW